MYIWFIVVNISSASIVCCEPPYPCCYDFCCSSFLSRILSFIFFHLPFIILLYTLISVFSIVIILPCCFLLLIQRTSTIEHDINEGFNARAEILTTETIKQKTMRMMSVLIRGIIMFFIIVIIPILFEYVIFQSYNYDPIVINACIGSYLIIGKLRNIYILFDYTIKWKCWEKCDIYYNH